MTNAEFQNLFNEHKNAVYRFAWRMTGSATVAEDLTQEVFLSLLRHQNRFNPERGSMRAFLLGIARNLALKRWRDEARWEELGEEHFPSQPMTIPQFDLGGISEIVGIAVRSLPPLQREVLILAEYEGLSLDEIARAVDAETGTVKSRLHRARENLRRVLAPWRSEKEVRTTRHGST